MNINHSLQYIQKGLFFLEFELEGIDCGSHLCIQNETVPETGSTICKGFLAIASSTYVIRTFPLCLISWYSWKDGFIYYREATEMCCRNDAM